MSSAYVAYRGAVPIEKVEDLEIIENDVVIYIGPRCHFVQYPLREGEMFNQVAVFESAKALAGEDPGVRPTNSTPPSRKTCAQMQTGLPHMWRDRWWRMFDRDPIKNWVKGRVALRGDAAHPPLQYLAQGAVMAMEDGWVLADHVGDRSVRVPASRGDRLGRRARCLRGGSPRTLPPGGRDRPEWGDLWHHDGVEREQRNAILRERNTYDYSFVDWIYGPTALTPDQEPDPCQIIPLDSAKT